MIDPSLCSKQRIKAERLDDDDVAAVAVVVERTRRCCSFQNKTTATTCCCCSRAVCLTITWARTVTPALINATFFYMLSRFLSLSFLGFYFSLINVSTYPQITKTEKTSTTLQLIFQYFTAHFSKYSTESSEK